MLKTIKHLSRNEEERNQRKEIYDMFFIVVFFGFHLSASYPLTTRQLN